MNKNLLLILFVSIYQICYAQPANYYEARKRALADISHIGVNLQYNSERNIYIDQNNVIHIFIFEDGNLLLAGYPSTATEKDKYQVHLYMRAGNEDVYTLEYTGSYTPVLNIEGAKTRDVPGADEIKSIDFAIIGPFTNTLQLTIKRLPKGSSTYSTLVSATIQVAKTIHASIGSGLLYTSLKNPSNIRKARISNTGNDSTLIADDIKGRGVIAVFATYYPWGRNALMMPGKSAKDRMGILVGTSIGGSTSSFNDFFCGISYDFSIGGALALGVHYGRRQRLRSIDYHTFSFGATKFSGNVDDYKYMKWDAGFFFGVEVDSRIFSQIFK